jgi:hypothetical protein
MESAVSNDTGQWVGVEAGIVRALSESADELAHAECFDQEQRAELYTILQAIQADTANHRQMIDLLAAKLQAGQGGGNA